MQVTGAPAGDRRVLEDEVRSPEQRQLTVYYDGACPLCRREIDFYRWRCGGESVAWVDAANLEDDLISADLTRAEALARFHVRLPNGTLESGARGFGELWAALPGFRWLGRLCRVRALQPVLEVAYRGFLGVRPAVRRVAAKI